jgi:uncharacterized protein YkwD
MIQKVKPKPVLWFVLKVLSAAVILTFIVIPALAQSDRAVLVPHLSQAYELIDEVNRLRIDNGLPPYQVNDTLMGVAQGHSDYQASIGDVTHEGPGGSSPGDRAKAAGYGGGARIFISENIAGGTSLSPQRAVELWQGDAPHLNTILSPNNQDAGAGVAVSGSFVYYTLNTAHISDDPGVPPATAGTPGPAVTIVAPGVTSTPNPDGSIIHVVQYGQTLIWIANVYGVTVAYLKGINGLTGDEIFVGDRLIIQVAHTATPTGQQTATVTRTPQPTKTASRTPTLVRASPTSTHLAPTNTPTPTSITGSLARVTRDPFLLIIVVLTVTGGALMAVGAVLRRRK